MINYNKSLEAFDEYVNICKQEIKNTFFSNDEFKNEKIRNHRNEMIEIKINHTMRIVNDVTKMCENLGINVDFIKLVKVSALLHDIARFNQAVWADSFVDKRCDKFNGMSHAEYGYQILYVNKRIKDFYVPNNYQFAVSQTVKFHQVPVLTGDLNLKLNNVDDLDISVLTGLENLKEEEKLIVSVLVQMVKDVDMLDILYQHLTGEFPVIRPSIAYDVDGESLTNISKNWGISEKEILEYNELKEFDINGLKVINIPVINMDLNKLIVPRDIQDKFFKNERMDLKELQQRKDWTFIIGMWWRLNHFLNNINFTSNLELIKQNGLLDEILNQYPEKYRFLVKPAFDFAKKVLIEKRLADNIGNIYIKEDTKQFR